MNNWIDKAIFYHIYPLGFCGAPLSNDYHSSAEGRILKINNWVSHLNELGINALYLGPVFEAESHGYDTVDYYHIDRRLGNNEILKNVVQNLHNNGIRIILDGVFNHTSRHFFAFKDIQKNKWNSRYKDWYYGIDFSNRSPMGDDFSYHCWNGFYNLPKLNLHNEEVVEHILNAVRFWIEELNIDGLRLDAADNLDFNFMSILSKFCKSIKSDFFIIGEVIHGDYSRWANENTIDSTTNYEAYKGLYSSHNDNNFFEIAYTLNREFGNSGLYKHIPLYNFADNHDVDRVATKINNKIDLFTLYTMLFTIPGIPSIYYGSEWGIEGKKDNTDREIRPNIDINYVQDYVQGLRAYISKLANIRKTNVCLTRGDYRQIILNHNLFVYERNFDNKKVIIVLNSEKKDIDLELNLYNGEYKDLITENKIYSVNNGGKIKLKVPRKSALILEKV